MIYCATALLAENLLLLSLALRVMQHRCHSSIISISLFIFALQNRHRNEMHLFVSFLHLLLLIAAKTEATKEDSYITSDEATFLKVPEATSAKQHLRFITSQPHVAGTPGDYVMADFVSKLFKEAGIPDVTTFELDVLLNYPQSPPRLSLLKNADGTVLFQAKLSEELLDDTSDTDWRNNTFHGYSPSGDIKAPLVYANYGRPQDFDALEKAGISVKDTLVIVRYGKCFRGLKVFNAQERGAVGVLIYSDPADDGYTVGEVYPAGPWRPASGVQRGSVQFLSRCAGDPARADSRYPQDVTVESLCGYQESELVPQIPSLPISYGDALPLLETIGGMPARVVGGDDFVGGLNIEYCVGPSVNSVVHLVVDNKQEYGTIPNVIGLIPGTLPVDEDMPVLLGNHRDAWVYGAADPNSGTASLLEVARGLGALLKTGWKPRRSIYLLSWSGEEYGLLGSTGWAELNLHRLERAAVYLNVDTVVSGDMLSVKATPSLATLWEDVLNDLVKSDHAVAFANGPVGVVRDGNTNWVLNHPEVGMLGSGSDFTVFLDHLGIASLDFSFEKETTYGQYHSIYDSFNWMDAFGGREGETGSAFELMAFSAKIWGLMALRVADSNQIPFNHIVQGKAISLYTETIEKQQGAHDLKLQSLKRAVVDYQQTAATLHLVCANGLLDDATCNEKLALTERYFLAHQGLPERPWFKHILQAPGVHLGYASQAFPGVQQAIDAGDWDLARQQVTIVTERVQEAASFLRIDVDEVTTE